MCNFSVARIAHVLPFIDVLQDVGSPVYRELQRWSLPTLMAEQPDRYIPELPVIQCLRSIELHEGIPDLGFLAFQRWSLSSLDAESLAQVRQPPTLFSRLQRFAGLCQLENPDLELHVLPEGSNTRIAFDLRQPHIDGVQYSHWLQIAALIGLTRDTAGPDWQPTEVTMSARYTPGREAQSAFPLSRLLTGHRHTSILVPTSLMSRVCRTSAPQHSAKSDHSCDDKLSTMHDSDIAVRLRLTLPVYLGDGYPQICLAAMITGTSVRTLQRELSRLGTSYSELVQQVRFEEAVELLADPAEKIIDIGLALGYEDASHFARAFRRTSGVSPRQYRQQHFLH